jgi:adenylate cyclase class 2
VSTEKRLEIEIKVRIGPLPPWREKLTALGASVESPRELERNLVFDTPGNALRERGVLLRLRRCGARNILTMKKPARRDAAYKIREETEADVSDFAGMEAILRGIGFRTFFAYEKYREVMRLGDVLVMIDETPIGNFLEIEGEPAAIDGAAALLGFSRGDYITDSYYRLFLASGYSGEMVFRK